ncbi:transmembrane protein, putative [Medicago truncatula]|uniref:Transmembrane protein, putative n=1 Tax=Medicago truncatula TaxID=3880 RepID=G7J091_MEDTR|nr:transmembrane protein, putative [Medicago truncatula]
MVDQSLLLRGRKLLSSFKFLGRFSSGSRVEECLSDLIRQFAGYYSVYAGFWRFSWVLVLALGLENCKYSDRRAIMYRAGPKWWQARKLS